MLTVIRELAEEAEREGAPRARRRRAAARARRRGRGDASRARPRCSPCCARRASSTRAARACSRSCAGSRPACAASRCRRRRSEHRGQRRRDPPGALAATATARSSWSRARTSTRTALEQELEQLGDSLLVVGDATALKVHVHTDDPGARSSLGVRARDDRPGRDREHARADGGSARSGCSRTRRRRDERRRPEVVAVVAGDGNRRLFESLGAGADRRGRADDEPVDRGHARRDRGGARAPRSSCCRTTRTSSSSAEQAARLASKPVRVVRPSRSRRGSRRWSPSTRAARRRRTRGDARGPRRASRPARSRSPRATSRSTASPFARARGSASPTARPVAGGGSFDEVARRVLERLLAEPRDVLTLLTGAEAPDARRPARARVGEQHPDLELEVQDGRPAALPLLLSAE